jgi:hypothetical protein
MMPNVRLQARHFRRELPSLSLPQPMVGSPQERQAVDVGVGLEAAIVFLLDGESIVRTNYGHINGFPA